jgi:hypothetical protein
VLTLPGTLGEMATTDELWHLVEARRDDGTPAMFRIRDLQPRPDQPTIFVVEMPYPVTGLSRLPDAKSYRRLTQFEEQWLIPACAKLAWTFVAAKTEDGSFFLYLYGNAEPTALIEKLSPFDGGLGFFNEHDPNWEEYEALKELVDQANAMPADDAPPRPRRKNSRTSAQTRAPATRKPATKAKAAAKKPAATKRRSR